MRYFVVGDGGALYGPVDQYQLQEWVNQSRVLPTTKLKEEATGRFIFASEVPSIRFSSSQNPLGGYETIADFQPGPAQGQSPAPYTPPQSSSQYPGPTGQPPGSNPYGEVPSNPQNPYGSQPYGPTTPGGSYQFGSPLGSNVNDIDTTTPLIKSIVGLSVCCCCGSVCSIVGLVYSIQASSAKTSGSHTMVLDLANRANAWSNWGLIINTVFIIGYAALNIIGLVSLTLPQ